MTRRANSYAEITADAQLAIENAAEQVDATVADMQRYYIDGDEWDAETVEELTDLLVECWNEQKKEDDYYFGRMMDS